MSKNNIESNKKELFSWANELRKIAFPPLDNKGARAIVTFALDSISEIADEVEKQAKEL